MLLSSWETIMNLSRAGLFVMTESLHKVVPLLYRFSWQQYSVPQVGLDELFTRCQ